MQLIFPRYTIGHFINQPDNRTEFEILRFERMDEPDVDDQWGRLRRNADSTKRADAVTVAGAAHTLRRPA